MPGDCGLVARKHLARLHRGTQQALDEAYCYHRFRDVEALVRLLPDCPAVHMVHALFQLVLTEPIGAFESIDVALRLAAAQADDGRPPDDDLLHESIVREQHTLERTALVSWCAAEGPGSCTERARACFGRPCEPIS